MAWVEVYGGQRSLAFELTTAILWLEIHNKCALGAMATMDDYASMSGYVRQSYYNCYLWELPRIRLYRKIPKISPQANIFQRPFLRAYFWKGLYSEGLIYGGKFAFQNRLDRPYSLK